MASLSLQIVDTVQAIEPSLWRRLAADDDPLWSWQFFAHMESTGVGPDRFEYLLVYRRGELAAIMPAFMFRHYPLELSSGPLWMALSRRIRGWWPGFFSIPVYFCGHPMAQGRLLRSASGSEHEIAYIRQQARARADLLGYNWLVFKDFRPSAVSRVLADKHCLGIPALPDAVLELPVTDFEAYLRAIKPKARRNIRAKQRHFERHNGFSMDVQSWPDDLAGAARRLYLQVLRRAPTRLDVLSDAFFDHLSAVPGLQLKTVTVREAKKPVAFALFLFHGTQGYCLRVGMDYERIKSSMAYFVMHYQVIKLAIENRCRQLNFCQTTYHFKRELGCRMMRQDFIVSHRNRMVQALLPRVLPSLFSHYRKRNGFTGAYHDGAYHDAVA